MRAPWPRNPAQKQSRVEVKGRVVGDEVHIPCHSESRTNEDRAIREKHERRLIADLKKLQRRIGSGRLVKEPKIHQVIGRLRERHARVASYYCIEYEPSSGSLTCSEDALRKAKAEVLDGVYLLKTSSADFSADEICERTSCSRAWSQPSAR